MDGWISKKLGEINHQDGLEGLQEKLRENNDRYGLLRRLDRVAKYHMKSTTQMTWKSWRGKMFVKSTIQVAWKVRIILSN